MNEMIEFQIDIKIESA